MESLTEMVFTPTGQKVWVPSNYPEIFPGAYKLPPSARAAAEKPTETIFPTKEEGK